MSQSWRRKSHPTTIMRILIALTYYRPHYSGLTIYTERVARALAARGHQVTILTSRFDRSLPAREIQDGVEIIRPKVWLRISKGVIMPGILAQAWKLARKADVIHLHLPQLDAAPITMISKLLGKPVVLTYHCDLRLPTGWVHSLANRVSDIANQIAARLADAIVHNTRDYAENSDFLLPYLHKLHPIYPPVESVAATNDDRQAFRQKYGLKPGQRVIGMVARLATEKGVEYLAQALPLVMAKYPEARVLSVGPYQDVIGEEEYARRLRPQIEQLGDHWSFLGVIPPVELAAFFHECDVTVLPSINSTESYGLVQVESMACGTPVAASDIPGVRVPVQMTGMGLTVPACDGPALAAALIRILDKPQEFRGHPEALIHLSTPEAVASQYEELFSRVTKDFLWLHLRELPYFRGLLRAVEARFYQDIELPSPVLDVGCGDGHFVTATFNSKVDVGIDPSSDSLREAARREGYYSLLRSEGASMPIPDHFFNSAFSNSVLEHIPDIDNVLLEVSRVLSPGAPFVFCVPNHQFLSSLSIGRTLDRLGLRRLGNAYRAFFNRIARHYHSDPPEIWQKRLERAGFTVENWWHYYSPQALAITEWGHYFGLPCLVWRRLTGRWILAPTRWNMALTYWLTSRHYNEATAYQHGVCTFYIARRNAL